MTDENQPKSPFGDLVEIPDLDLSDAGRRHSGPAPAPSAAPRAEAPPQPGDDDPFDALSSGVTLGASGAADLLGAGFDEGHFGSDLQEPSGGYSGGGFGDLDDDEPGVGNLDLASYRPPAPAGGAPAAGAPWPTGESPERAFLQIDPLEIATVADYGPAPTGPHLTPLYALRVFQRQRVLRRELAQINAELTHLEAQRDELLAARGEALRPRLESDSRYAGVFEPLRALDQLAAERGQALQQTSAQVQQAAAAADAQKAEIDEKLAARAAPLAQATEAAQAAELEFKRVDARYKRFYIEVRGIRQAAGVEDGAPLPAEPAARVAQLEAQARQVQPELVARKNAAEQARAAVQSLEKEIAALHEAKKRIDAQQKRFEAGIRKQLDQRVAGAREAANARRTALADLYRKVLANRDDALDDATIAGMLHTDKAIERLALESEKRLRALDAFDSGGFTTGRNLAIGLAVALLVLLVILIAS